ncbi:STM4011 family radical SAM protein [Entomomonas asaccharolytica]|uniref:STM4011 family radical SAM protein n=1 Tax=Entomomonas asaccharolytica TaxID=2785331 RepID=A0A974NGA3_9GAMM|nr:STM4011 family radical SAM protein [Entomomonas asaccharolytica]QQP86003.1 STM4011 family radical SAM protein [Entomomonas asaccharolytica]
MINLTVMYRGALETCNYACDYCPFAKRKETKQKKIEDIVGLDNFINWIAKQTDINFNVFFTPWGEALVFKRYQQAVKQLTVMPHVNKVIFQTNLSGKLDFLAEINSLKLRLWCTYHPTEVPRKKFIDKTKQLDCNNVKYSVGMVGKPNLFDEIKQLRNELNPNTYLWINAYVDNNQHYIYTEEQRLFLSTIDSLFSFNKSYVSKGLLCFAGENAIVVDEFGKIYRCHFIKQAIGSIHDNNWQQILQERPCTRANCDCHIGYIFVKSLDFKRIFGEQTLERIMLD